MREEKELSAVLETEGLPMERQAGDGCGMGKVPRQGTSEERKRAEREEIVQEERLVGGVGEGWAGR